MPDTPLNILMVTAWDPTIPTGGVSTVIRTLTSELSRGHKVHVLFDDWDAVKVRTDQQEAWLVHRLRLRPPYDAQHPIKGFLGWLRDLPGTLAQLRRLLRCQVIDVIHLHYASSYQSCFRILRMLGGPPYVVTLHRGDVVNFQAQSRLDRLLTSWTLSGAAQITAVSNWLARVAQETVPGCRDIVCVHNGLDLSIFRAEAMLPSGDILRLELPEKFFVNVANVTYNKGQDVAIRAWAQVRRRCPDLHLVIVGDQREHWQVCEDLIRDLDLGDRVHMVGPLSRRDVLAVMSQAMAMLFPSRSEGFPLALIESSLMKLPAICSDIAPLTELVGGEKLALFVPVEDFAALSAAVITLADDLALCRRLGNALYKRVTKEFTALRMAESYLAIYREVCRGDPDQPAMRPRTSA